MLGRTSLACCAVGVVLVGCATVISVGTDPIDSRYAIGGGEWDSGGGITTATRAFERNGVTVICGAWTMDRQSGLTSGYNEDVLEAGSIFLAGDRAVQNLSFMRQVPYSENITGEQANCVAAGLPWKPDYATAPARVRLLPMVFEGLDAEFGELVHFRETRRMRIIR